jgi:hypothetical protein
MRFGIRHALVGGLCVGLALVASCSQPPGEPSGDRFGTVGFQLQGVPGVTFNTVNWSIANAGTGFSRSGSVNVQESNTLTFQVGGLPAGGGYLITLTATTVGGTFNCAGSASFTVSAGSAVGVAVTLACTPPAPDAGSVIVTGTTVVCETVTSLSAAPLETNSTITLSATASAGAAAPVFAWSATAGTFDNPASASPTFTCPATPGAVTITVSLGSNDAACGAAAASASITVTCDAPDPTFTNVYADIIGLRCVSCHHPGGSGVTVGMLDMGTEATAYANLVGVPVAGTGAGTSGVTCASQAPGLLRVAANNVNDSALYLKTSSKLAGTNPPCGSPMPLPATAAPLTQGQIDLIAGWINAGAPNN